MVTASPCELLSATEDDFNEKQAYAYAQAGTDIAFDLKQYTLGKLCVWSSCYLALVCVIMFLKLV